MNRILVDTGPLVAVASSGDKYHHLCLATLKEISIPLLTCWPVITEAACLLRDHPQSVHRLLTSIAQGFLEILPLPGNESEQISRLMDRYSSLRPQFADVVLVHLAHRENIDTIFTLDRRDFSVYRTARRRPFRLLPHLTRK